MADMPSSDPPSQPSPELRPSVPTRPVTPKTAVGGHAALLIVKLFAVGMIVFTLLVLAAAIAALGADQY